MDEKTKLGIRKAFIEAKKLLSKKDQYRFGNHAFICCCIMDAYGNKKVGLTNAQNATEIIQKAISPYLYADSWAIAHGYKGDKQVWRHAWLDRLIEEYS